MCAFDEVNDIVGNEPGIDDRLRPKRNKLGFHAVSLQGRRPGTKILELLERLFNDMIPLANQSFPAKSDPQGNH